MKLLCAFLTASSALFAQVIEGTVVNSLTGGAISGVTVTIETAGKTAYHATTDAQGAFLIEGVKDGYYTANFSHAEFVAPAPGTAIRRQFRVGPGSDPIRLHARLMPLGRVSGRVFDADGRPVPSAVLLLEDSRSGATKTSDQQGNYSFQVSPGGYILSARPPSALKPPVAVDKERMHWVHTYYPGVLDPQAAVKIVVRAGEEMWGEDVRLRAVPVRRVRGVVLDTRGDVAPHIPVRVEPALDTLAEGVHTVSSEDGSFEFPDLHDGEWLISAEAQNSGAKLRAFAATEVAGRDVDRLELHLTAPFTIRGSVSFVGREGLKAEKKAVIFLRPSVVGSEGFSQGSTDQDGTFKLENVYPGAYKIVANSPGPPYYLASIRVGDQEALGQYVELTTGTLPIKITFESNGGRVRGAVDQCGSATIVLTPRDSALQEPQFVRTASCREGGRFEITNIRPGDYYAFAFDRWEGPVELISSLDQALINNAVGVRASRGEVATVDLRVTTRDR